MISKPLSAMTESPGWSRSKNPERRVSSLSEIDPGKSLETKVTAPLGDIPTRALKVL